MKKVEHPEIIQKILDGEKLSEDELSEAVYEFDSYKYETIVGDDRRWVRDMSTVLRIDDKYFKVDWDQALTENQEDEFFSQFEQVALSREEKIVIINKYTPI